ncbi:MAG: tail fiber domain-containing protein [Chitinophagaceae bacterium]
MKKNVFLLAFFLVSMLPINAQNVGIGTTNPIDKFSVQNSLPGYGFTHTYGNVTVGSYINSLTGQFGTKSNHPLQFFTNNGVGQITLLQNGNVGIGTTAPSTLLDVAGGVLSEGSFAGFRFNDRFDNTKGYQWYSIGGNAYLYRQQAPAANAISVLANGNVGLNVDNPLAELHVNPAGSGSILLGTSKSSGGYTALEMGISAQSGGAGYIQSITSAGSSYGSLYLNPSGAYVGINFPTTTTLFAPLDINQSSSSRGIRLRNNVTLLSANIWDMYVDNQLRFNVGGFFAAYLGDDGSYNQVSDARLKTNVTAMGTVLEKVMLLQPKKYRYKKNSPTSNLSSGFLAQEVLPLFPELVGDFQHPTSDTTDQEIYHSLNYAGFGVIAIKAIQEQQATINKLSSQNVLLVSRLEKLEAVVTALQVKK